MVDGGVFSHSNFGISMEHNTFLFPEPQHLPGTCTSETCPYVFVADEAFSLNPYLLHPYAGKYLPEPLQMFNYRLSRARRVIENTFGIMAANFKVFRRPIIAHPDKVTKITKPSVSQYNQWRLEIRGRTNCSTGSCKKYGR